MSGILCVLTIALPWFGGLVAWGLGNRKPFRVNVLAAVFAVLTAVAAVMLLTDLSVQPAVDVDMGGVFGHFTLVADGLGVFLTLVASVIGSLAVIFSADYLHGSPQLARYYALVMLFIGAMDGLVLSGSLLFMFIFWEITAFCSYALIAFDTDDPKAVAGGIKALVMTQLGGIGLLAGAMVAYTQLGSYQVADLLAGAAGLPAGVLAGLAFGFLAAAAAKSAQVPFHTWLPDAMEAPTPISALIHAATMVNAGVYLVARFYPAFSAVSGWTLAVVIIGFLSAALAGVMAIAADDLKRALAYSTISQLGFMFYAVGVGSPFASQFHLMSHSVFKALLFLCAGAVIHSIGTRDMRQMGGLGKQLPFTRSAFIIGCLGLVGLPVANGFFSKELILEAGLEHGPVWAYWGMVVLAGVTAVYSIRMVSLVFYGPRYDDRPVHGAPRAMRVVLGILAAGTVVSWLLVGGFSEILSRSLPFHEIERVDTFELAGDILFAPATWMVLVVIAIGVGLWAAAARSGWSLADPPLNFIRGGMGFEAVNRGLVGLTNGLSRWLRRTQTGHLSWNSGGLLIGLIVVLAFLVGRM